MPRQSIKQRTDGRYKVKYHGKQFYGATQSEAIAKRDEYRRQVEQGLREEAIGTTFAEYAVRWIHTFKAGVARNTFNAYAHIINDAAESIGAMLMTDITLTDVQELFNSRIGKSASDIKKYCATITSIFDAAQADGIIVRNPCTKAARPSGTKGTHRAIEPWERDLIHASVGHHDMALAAMVMLYAGLRRGEACAIDIDRDVDFINRVIHVREAVHFENNRAVIASTKTAAGVREVPLLDPLRDALFGHHGKLLSAQCGDVMTQAAFKRKWESYMVCLERIRNGCQHGWYGRTKDHKAILASGGSLPPWVPVQIRSHDLRHSFATMLYNADVDVLTAVRWMGHADEKMIMKIYAHLTEEKMRSSGGQVNELAKKLARVQNGVQIVKAE